MKNVHVFVLVFLCAVTMLIFQIKRIISSEKWCNYVVTFLKKNAKNLGRSDDGIPEKKRGWPNLVLCLTKFVDTLLQPISKSQKSYLSLKRQM